MQIKNTPYDGLISLIDALIAHLPDMRDDLVAIRQRAFRLGGENFTSFVSKKLGEQLSRVNDPDCLVDHITPLIGEFSKWNWEVPPLWNIHTNLLGKNFMDIEAGDWFGSAASLDDWNKSIENYRKKLNAYTIGMRFYIADIDQLNEVAIDLMAFGYSVSKLFRICTDFITSWKPANGFNVIFFFDNEGSQILAKIKYPDAKIYPSAKEAMKAHERDSVFQYLNQIEWSRI